MKKSFLFILSVLSLLGVSLNAQERVVYDQYHFNYFLINPAVCGADKCSHIMLTTKNNWIGLDGPTTQTLSYRSRLNNYNVGLGGYLYNDKTPNFNNIGGQLTFAYHIPMSNGGRFSKSLLLDRQLSFGASVKVTQLAYTSHNTSDPSDESFSEVAPNANVGVYYVSYGYFAGLSATNLIPYRLLNTGTEEPINPLTTFLFTGYDFDLGSGRQFEPSVNFNFNNYNNKQVELNLKYAQNDQETNFGFWTQLSYRHNLDKGSGQPISLIPMAGLRVNKFQIAYAFNMTLNDLASYNLGTHEFMLAYTFCVPQHFCR
jgi:type IX secretion system PorP/SprF family membrane protein